MTTRLAVLGSPIAHSKSPAIHAAAYAELGLDWEYERVEVSEGGLADFVAGLGPEWRGLSLTMPLKREAPRVATSLGPGVAELGQANTLLLGDETAAFTTDAFGIREALLAGGLDRPGTATVLGGGATAESAVAALHELGAEVSVAVRSPERAARLADRASVVPLEGAPLDVDAVVSTVPGGALVLEAPPGAGMLLDVVYDPWPTPLAAAWSAAGGVVVDGLEMLLHQALAQVRIFVTGDPGEPVRDEATVWTAMRRSVGRGAGA